MRSRQGTEGARRIFTVPGDHLHDARALDQAAQVILRRSRKPGGFMTRILVSFLQHAAIQARLDAEELERSRSLP